MLDEQHLNQRGHFGYTAGLLSPLLGDIQTTEVILGPGAILHGSGAINGFINLIPKNGKDNPGPFLTTEYGFTDKLWKVETGYGTSYGTLKNIYLYAGAYGAKGFKPDELYGYSPNYDSKSFGFEDENYRFSLYWNHNDFNLNTFYFENNPYKNGSFEIGQFHQATLGFRPKYTYKINDTDSLTTIGSLLWFDHRSPREEPPASGDIRDRGGSENHLELKNIYRTRAWENHSLAAGFSFGEKRFYQKRQFFSDDAAVWFGTLDTKWQELGIFTEDVIDITDSWVVSFGLRYDKIYLETMSSDLWKNEQTPDQIKGHFSPRIATAYEIDKGTTIKASYQHGFRTPDAFYYVQNQQFTETANALGFATTVPSLGVETMDSFELNLYKDVPRCALKLDFNLFYNIFNNQLSFKFYDDLGLFTPEERQAMKAYLDVHSTARLGSFLNEDKEIKSYGGEVNAIFQPLPHTEISLSYGYVQLVNADFRQYPAHQIKLNTQSKFLDDKLSLSLSYLYNNNYSKTDLSDAHDIYRKDRHVVNMALHYAVTPKITIGMTANNLFETDVPPMVFEPNDLDRGGLGYDERRIYASLNIVF